MASLQRAAPQSVFTFAGNRFKATDSLEWIGDRTCSSNHGQADQ
ncbi:hypothetical protein EV14_1365 [Prochlorococcus sp. MIT 0703]|nr:hypothetical protein EV14_1365 [Prochlorococcus sp. MIT 0703]